MKEDLKRSYLKGFEAGLKDAWSEISRLTSRGYSSTELNIMAKSKIAVISRTIEAKARELEQMEIVFEEEKVSKSVGELPDHRGSYIVKEEKAETIYKYFTTLLEKNKKGLCITRTHPKELGLDLDTKNVKYLWLSRSEKDAGQYAQSVSPTELAKLASQIVIFMDKSKQSVVLLEGIEYLFSQNGFQPVLRFVQMLSEKSVVFNSYLLLSLNPAAMSEREYRLLAKEMTGEL